MRSRRQDRYRPSKLEASGTDVRSSGTTKAGHVTAVAKTCARSAWGPAIRTGFATCRRMVPHVSGPLGLDRGCVALTVKRAGRAKNSRSSSAGLDAEMGSDIRQETIPVWSSLPQHILSKYFGWSRRKDTGLCHRAIQSRAGGSCIRGGVEARLGVETNRPISSYHTP